MVVTSCPLSVDASFGPWAGQCRGGFDFTRFFEESILLIPSSSLLLLASLVRIAVLLRRRRAIVNTKLLLSKLTLFVLFTAVNLALLIAVARQDDFRTSASIAAYTLRLITGPALLALSYFEHIYTLRPSTLISAYLLALLLLDAAHMRTLALEFPHRGPTIAFGISMGFEVLSLLTECVRKKETVGVSFASLSPEATSNLFVRQTFFWLKKILRIGYSRTITTRDLYNLDAAIGSEKLARSFRKLGLDKGTYPTSLDWYRSSFPTDGHGTGHSLVLESLWKLRWAILAAFPGRLCTTAFTFAQPFLLSDTTLLAALPVTKETDQQGYGLIGAFILVYLGMAIAGCQYQYKITRVMTMLRGGLVGLIYERSMRLSPKDQAKASAALTHMSTDVEFVTSAGSFIHEIWACPLEVGIGIWLIQRQLGIACLIPVVVAIVAGSVTALISARVNTAQTAWISKMTQRIGSTGITLNSAAGLKLSNLLDKAMQLLQVIREDELRISKPFRKLMIVNMLLGYFTPIISPVLTFLVFALVNRSDPNSVFTVERAFSSLTLLYIVATPMTQIITMTPVCIVALNSFKRIESYCKVQNHPAGEESRGSKEERLLSTSPENGDGHSLTEVRGTGYGQTALRIQKGQFSWTSGNKAEVDGINVDVPKSAFVLVVGPTGSGKSTILKALINEVPVATGIEYLMPGPIGYCAQTPWLPAGTALEVILGGSQFEPDWYETVVKACQLKFDFKLWDKGDKNQIGSNGAALSGGQRQRLAYLYKALARCVYSKAKLMLFDDSLRGLDAGTKQAVFQRVFGPKGLLRQHGITLLMVSSSREYSDFTDQVLTLGSVFEAPEDTQAEAPAANLNQIPDANTSSSSEVSPKPDLDDNDVKDEKDVKEEATIADITTEEGTVGEQEAQAKEEADYNRRFGASGSYKYYIKPVAWSALISFTIFILIFTFCQAFPTPGVWLKMWSQYNTLHPGGQLGRYLGVYAALGVGALISLVIACW
ncbi:multidrug resistance-like protein [Aureobasidium pullulans]|nr:multidrug resistance-like protein [Aureobasidium pullulans]